MHKVSEVDILAIGVHPDDVELSAMGTLIKHKSMGYTFGLCDLTMGELGTRGDAETRLNEAEESAKISGATFRVNLGFEDGFIQHDKETIIGIAKLIRRSKPKIVLANAIRDRHPDHGRAAKITQDACFYAGLPKIEIKDYDGSQIPAYRPAHVYHYVQDMNIEPDFLVDISDHIEAKFEAIKCFKTQFFSENMEGPKTPISGKDFMEFLRSKNNSYGRAINAEYAEGFNVVKTLGVDDLFDLR
jgi:N-acetylglucosamine malate deacetylase 1